MCLCKRTKQLAVTHSIFKRYVFVVIIIAAFSQTTLSDAKRTKGKLSQKGRFITSLNARSRRQAEELDTDLSPDIVLLNFEDEYEEYPNLDEEFNYCPSGCRCISDEDAVCAFLSLSTIPPNLPPQLVKLSLAYNRLENLPRNAFAEYSNSLKHLLLQSNHLSRLDGVFGNLTNVEVLRLSWNKLTAIRKMTFSGLFNLKQLYLDNNLISFFHPNALRGLVNLRLLNLEGNRLTQLHPDTFVTLQFYHFFKYDMRINIFMFLSY